MLLPTPWLTRRWIAGGVESLDTCICRGSAAWKCRAAELVLMFAVLPTKKFPPALDTRMSSAAALIDGRWRPMPIRPAPDATATIPLLPLAGAGPPSRCDGEAAGDHVRRGNDDRAVVFGLDAVIVPVMKRPAVVLMLIVPLLSRRRSRPKSASRCRRDGRAVGCRDRHAPVPKLRPAMRAQPTRLADTFALVVMVIARCRGRIDRRAGTRVIVPELITVTVSVRSMPRIGLDAAAEGDVHRLVVHRTAPFGLVVVLPRRCCARDRP